VQLTNDAAADEAKTAGSFPILETALQYKTGFPESDLDAIQVHLLVGTVGMAQSQRLNSLLADLSWPMSTARFSLIRLLFFSDRHQLTQTEIARALGNSPGNVTQLVDGLVRDGLVERIPSETSRRVIFARLTSEGKECAQKTVPAMLDFMLKTCSRLSREEMSQLTTLVRKYLDGLSGT
jgi:DNA-binding MarR family transcriptional regulator